MRWDYAPLDVNPVFPGLGEIIMIILILSFTPVQFLKPFSLPLRHLFFLPQPCFHKHPQSKTFLNVEADCSIAVFFQFFYEILQFPWCATKCPYYRWNGLDVFNVHILLISLFSPWYISIFFFSFLLTVMSPSIAISMMAQLLSFLFTTIIWFPCFDHSVIFDHKIPQNLHFIFKNTFWSMFIPFFTFFQFVFPTIFQWTILATLSCLLLYSFCTPFEPTFHIHSQYEVLINFLVTKTFLSHFYLFHLLFLAFIISQTVHTFFCFSIVPSFPSSISVWIPSYLFTLLLYSIVSTAFTPSLNGCHPDILSHVNFFHHYISLTIPLSFPPISLLWYTLSTSLFQYSAPCIVINFLVLLSKRFNSLVFYFRILALYLIIEIAQVLTVIFWFLSFSFNLNVSLNCHRYSLLNFSFISFSLHLSVPNISYSQPHLCLSCLAHLIV